MKRAIRVGPRISGLNNLKVNCPICGRFFYVFTGPSVSHACSSTCRELMAHRAKLSTQEATT